MLNFLKLGGSLITNKDKPYTALPDRIVSLAVQIKTALADHPEMRLLLGHGSGSFGHESGRRYQTRAGVRSAAGWVGFTKVWHDARSLNNIIMDSLHAAGVPAIAMPPSALCVAKDQKVLSMHTKPIQEAISNGLVPVVFGDVAFDEALGGTILSTEDVFAFLAPLLQPKRILIAGIERGVWQNVDRRDSLIDVITPANYAEAIQSLSGSRSRDVTGGMRAKVEALVDMLKHCDADEALIFSGVEFGVVKNALRSSVAGTKLTGFGRSA